MNVEDNNDITAIWAHHLTREEGKPKLQWLSYGLKNGNTQTQINKRNLQWKTLSKEEQAEITKKLKPLKWLLQKYVRYRRCAWYHCIDSSVVAVLLSGHCDALLLVTL